MTYQEIVKLADLVNMEVSEFEASDIISKLESVLGYVDQIKDIEIKEDNPKVVENIQSQILRPDEINQDENFPDLFMDNVPSKEAGYVKVNKILN